MEKPRKLQKVTQQGRIEAGPDPSLLTLACFPPSLLWFDDYREEDLSGPLKLTWAKGLWKCHVRLSGSWPPLTEPPWAVEGRAGALLAQKQLRGGVIYFSERKLCSGRKISTLYFYWAQL